MKENEKQRPKSQSPASARSNVGISEAVVGLSESDFYLDAFIDNLPSIVFVKEASTLRYVRLNRAGEQFTGVSRDHFIGKTDHDIFSEDLANQFMKDDRAALAGHEVIDIPEEQVLTPLGPRYLHTKKIPVFGPDNRPRFLLGISEDITEKRVLEIERLNLIAEQAARKEAEKNSEQMRFHAEASNSLNQSLNLEKTIRRFARLIVAQNADFCEIAVRGACGLKIEQLVIAHSNFELEKHELKFREAEPLDWKDTPGLGCELQIGETLFYPAMDEQNIMSHGFSPKRRDQLLRLNLRSIIAVPLEYLGQIIGSILIGRGEEKEPFQPQDLAVTEDLASRLATAIQNARLFKQATEASQAKSLFLANMSHEIRTPLTSILGYADLLSEDSRLEPTLQTYVSTIERNGKQLLDIVDEILDLSRVESDLIVVEKKPFCPTSLITEVIAAFQIQAQEKNLALRFFQSTELPKKLIGDASRIRQILTNIVGNALKFTMHGFVAVNVEFSDSILKIRVSDSGIGISSEQACKLFQPFVQADSSTGRRFGGTGLGLSLSRRIARLMGGDVTLTYSQPAAGSEFLITIKLEKTETKLRAQTRILVVDDAADNRTLLRLFLERLNYQVEEASGGQEAVGLALNKPFDVILMDIQMPGIDGFETLRILREKAYRGPILALTAHAMKGDRERCLDRGFDDFLSKPIERERLTAALHLATQSV